MNDDLTLQQRIEDLEFQLSQMKNAVNSLTKYNFAGSQAITKDTTVVSGFLQSGNYKTLTSGWKIEANGDAEFAGTILAGGYVQLFRQDAIPTSLHINDIWIDTNDSNKMYVAASVGADQITAGEWVLTNPASNWSEIIDDDTNKPDNNATVGATSATDLKDESAVVLSDIDFKNKRAYTAGETLVIRDSVFMETAIQTITLGGFTNNDGTTATFGSANSGGNNQKAQSFTGVGGSITKIIVRLQKVGTPTDNVTVDIRSVSQTGTIIASATQAGTGITVAYASYTLSFTKVALVAGTTYFVVFSRSGALDASNYYQAASGNAGATTGDITSGALSEYDTGAGWSAGSASASTPISLQIATEVGKVYKTTGGTAATSDGFIGFADAAIAQDASGNIKVIGVVSGFTGLTAGAQYRCDDSPTRGGIVTGGTNRKVGIALSTTEILINNNW